MDRLAVMPATILQFPERRSEGRRTHLSSLSPRGALEAAIEAAIALLDAIDPDTELEGGDADLEPSLASPEHVMDQRVWCRGADGDLEDEGAARVST
jgi:hypothetical protein